MKQVNDGKIRVWARQEGCVREEPVFRADALHFLFRNPVGRLLMRHVLSTKLGNNLITRRQRSRRSRGDIAPFIAAHKIDPSEFVEPVTSFRSFAEFFARELRPETRPVAAGPAALVAPCDGVLQWVLEPLANDTAFAVKGARFTLAGLLGDDGDAALFRGGTLLGFYLAPFDYHRFCYPCGGRVISRRRVGTRYYSVNEESVAAGFRVFHRNVRECMVLARGASSWGMVEVGGFYAGNITGLPPAAAAPTEVSKGMIKGCFEIGSSFIVLAFAAGDLRVDADIAERLATGLPVRLKLGEHVGTLRDTAARP